MRADGPSPSTDRYPEDGEGKPKRPLSAITAATLLAVEGQDDENFFHALVDHLRLAQPQIIPYNGTHQLPSKLAAIRNMSNFDMVDSFGVTADAEEDAAAAFQRVCSALRHAGFPVPDRPLSPVGKKPRVCVLILPPGANQGAIEDLCLQAVEGDPAMACVQAFFSCLSDQSVVSPANTAKARVQVFLASRPKAGMSLGVAARRDYWPWDNPAFDGVKQFLQQLTQPRTYGGEAPSI